MYVVLVEYLKVGDWKFLFGYVNYVFVILFYLEWLMVFYIENGILYF